MVSLTQIVENYRIAKLKTALLNCNNKSICCCTKESECFIFCFRLLVFFFGLHLRGGTARHQDKIKASKSIPLMDSEIPLPRPPEGCFLGVLWTHTCKSPAGMPIALGDPLNF